MPAKKEISFLPESENVNSLSSRIINWVVTVGRFIIVFTELIVIGAFLSRFWLDRRNADLSEIIRQNKAILESTQEFEEEYLLLQQRLKIIGDFSTRDQKIGDALETIASSTPPNIVFSNLSYQIATDKSPEVIAISAMAENETAIVDFVTNLSLNEKIKKVYVKAIEKKAKDNKYNITVNLEVNSQKL